MKDDESHIEDEIDLRKYVLLLVKRWRFMRDVLVVVALATLFFGLTGAGGAPQYQATAGLALVKSKTEVNLEDKIKTISPDTAALALAAPAQSSSNRSSTLASLVQNQLVAREVVKTMSDRLPPVLRDPEVLAGMIQGQVRKGTDIVDVIARGDDPVLVTDIANAWAVAYESYVNRIYSGVGISVGSIDQNVAAARADYERARDALLQYDAEDKTFQIQRDIDYRKGVIGALQTTRQVAITTILTKTVEVQTDIMGKYQSAALGMFALPTTKEVDDKISQLTVLYANKVKLQQTLLDAQTLRDQASKSPAGADSNSLALLLIKAQLATAGGLPSGLQLQVGAQSSGGGGSAAQVSDLDALISTLNSRLKEIQAAIDVQSTELKLGGGIQVTKIGGLDSSTNPFVAQAQKLAGDLLQLQGMDGVLANIDSEKGSPLTETLDRITSEVRQLGADLAREQYRKKELTQDYDIAWQAYSTLQGKAQEMDISAKLPGNEVAFVSPATRPPQLGAAGRLMQTLKNLGLAIPLALLVGVVGVFAGEFIWPEGPNVGIPWRSLWRRVSRRPTKRKTE
ncbi:MAG: hypothetical protein Q8R28_09605 [Dehalococcoidia bacterium]|nr:hypothetical protein [Dehalococcoidia bacterium]